MSRSLLLLRHRVTVASVSVWCLYVVSIAHGQTSALQALSQGGRASEASEAFRASPRRMAEQVLRVYATQDVAALLSLSVKGPAPASVVERYRPGTALHNSLFGPQSWRLAAVQRWDGTLKQIRVQRNAMVVFAEASDRDEWAIIGLTEVSGSWRYKGLFRWSKDRIPHWGDAGRVSSDTSPDRAAVAFARQVLTAYQQRDVAAVLKLSVADGPLALQDLNNDKQTKSQAERLFAREEMLEINAWDGNLRSIYVKEDAQVAFGRSTSDRTREVFVVSLQKRNGRWGFEDINSPDAEQFESWGTAIR